MKLVILGAGASFDLHHTYFHREHSTDGVMVKDWMPPLANDLFKYRQNFWQIMAAYPGAASFASDLSMTNDIEEYFQQKWDFIVRNRADDLLTRIINLQFYFQELFWHIGVNIHDKGHSNYDIILNQAYEYTIRTGEDVCFVTFNYDTLLEAAMARIYRTRLGNIKNYIDHQIKIIKPHGSCNWAKKFKVSFTYWGNVGFPMHSYLYMKGLSLSQIEEGLTKDIYLIQSLVEMSRVETTSSKGRSGFVTSGSFPQILIPLKSKDEFILPEEHLSCLTNFLDSVTEVLIIGWKGTEQNFISLLQAKFSDREIQFTTVNGLSGRNDFLRDLFPKCTFSNFYDTYAKNVDGKTLSWEAGTFSSYCLNCIRKPGIRFFK